jgi:hypothetical protein
MEPLKIGDEVEIRLAAKVVSVNGGAVLVDVQLARDSVKRRYRTFVDVEKLHPPSDESIRQKVVRVL